MLNDTSKLSRVSNPFPLSQCISVLHQRSPHSLPLRPWPSDLDSSKGRLLLSQPRAHVFAKAVAIGHLVLAFVLSAITVACTLIGVCSQSAQLPRPAGSSWHRRGVIDGVTSRWFRCPRSCRQGVAHYRRTQGRLSVLGGTRGSTPRDTRMDANVSFRLVHPFECLLFILRHCRLMTLTRELLQCHSSGE